MKNIDDNTKRVDMEKSVLADPDQFLKAEVIAHIGIFSHSPTFVKNH